MFKIIYIISVNDLKLNIELDNCYFKEIFYDPRSKVLNLTYFYLSDFTKMTPIRFDYINIFSKNYLKTVKIPQTFLAVPTANVFFKHNTLMFIGGSENFIGYLRGNKYSINSTTPTATYLRRGVSGRLHQIGFYSVLTDRMSYRREERYIFFNFRFFDLYMDFRFTPKNQPIGLKSVYYSGLTFNKDSKYNWLSDVVFNKPIDCDCQDIKVEDLCNVFITAIMFAIALNMFDALLHM